LLKFVQIRFITSVVIALRILRICTTLATVENNKNFSAVYYTEATVERERWTVEVSNSGEDCSDSWSL